MAASRLAITAGAFIALCTPASAQSIDVGKAEYLSGCASRHGTDGKGSGPVSQALKKHPADLTVLAKKNGGVFPLNALYEIIDGRQSRLAGNAYLGLSLHTARSPQFKTG